MNVIEHFIARYRKEYDYFDQVARHAAQMLEGQLIAAGIRSIVTSRAKAVDRLEAKVRERAARKNYASVEAIFDDIVDLAGMRVAMYFPGDHAHIDNIIRSLFDLVSDPITFPDPATPPKYKKRFCGYLATHYRVQLKETVLDEAEKHHAEARLEIQLASVLMHSWAEVEHDLVYKPRQGELSEEEYTILDELNGMVLAGELALERLQKAGETRVAAGARRFSNHYDLASHLLSTVGNLKGTSIGATALGRIDLLYELLIYLSFATPEHLKRYIASVNTELEKRPLSDQIIDQLLAEDKSRYTVYENLRARRPVAGPAREGPGREDQRSVDSFLQEWVGLEQKINEFLKTLGKDRIYASRGLLSKLGITDESLLTDFERIRGMRNEIVHGLAIPAASDLREAEGRIQEIIVKLIGLEARRADQAKAGAD